MNVLFVFGQERRALARCLTHYRRTGGVEFHAQRLTLRD
jgi:hypothetical protein